MTCGIQSTEMASSTDFQLAVQECNICFMPVERGEEGAAGTVSRSCVKTLIYWLSSAYRVQEYNICFTTVERGREGAEPALPPPGREAAPLPVILASILSKRAEVKKLLKSERDPVRFSFFCMCACTVVTQPFCCGLTVDRQKLPFAQHVAMVLA